MRPIIKWPGGKSREIDEFERLIPQFERYIEPFFGGGALFFHLEPSRAAVNDISRALMSFYAMAQRGDALFRELLEAYGDGFARLAALCGENSGELLGLYRALAAGEAVDGGVSALAARLAAGLARTSPGRCCSTARSLSGSLRAWPATSCAARLPTTQSGPFRRRTYARTSSQAS